MDKLVVFTSHYPYGNGEPFIEEEIKIAESCFNEILIVTYAKHNEASTRYIPDNAKIIHLRKDSEKTGKFFELLVLLKNLFRVMTWREIGSGIKERGINKVITIIRNILLFERHIDSIKKKEELWMESGSAQTVFYSYWLNSAAVYLSQNEKLNGIRICRTHGGDCFFDREYVPWRKDVIENLDMIFSISDGGKNDIMLHYGRFVKDIDKKIAVARLGVNIPESNHHASRFDKEDIIVTCSNIIPLKRLDLLIQALADQSIKHYIRWVHFGDGPLSDQISSLANRCLGRSEYVTYEFKGRKSKNEIMDYYRKSNVALFINCSDDEGIPVSIMEAMSYGIPAVARDVGSNRELVNDTCGALLPSKITSEELAICIEQLLDENAEAYHQKSIAAAQMVRKHYCAAENYKMFFREIEKILRENING